MPITRKQQLLAKLETTEGGGASFTGSDAIQVYDPSLSDTVDTVDRVPAGPTLSRDFTPIGRKTREITFTSDFRGSGTPATAPEWGKLITACGWKKNDNTNDVAVVELTCGTVSSGDGGFHLGEQVSQSAGSIYGVIVGMMRSGAPIQKADTSGDVLVVMQLVGTFTAAATVGSSSAASSSVTSPTAVTDRHAYIPTSEKVIQVDVASWSSAPSAGDTWRVENSGGDLVGSVQFISISGTTADVVLLWGAVANTDTLTDGTETGVVDQVPTMTRTPSIAMRHNLDGRNRGLLGARGTFSCEGSVGEPMTFSWQFTGDVGADTDAQPITTSGLSTVRAPRLLGAICMYGEGANQRTLQTKSINFDNGGTVSPNLDANSAGGATGANVTDRDPTLSVQVDNTNSTMDWEALRDAGSVVRAAFLLGTTEGNMVAIVVPNCQVTEVALGDADGVSVMDVTLRPRRIAESGDDEMYFVQL